MVTEPLHVGVDYLTATLNFDEGFYFYTIVKNIKRLPIFAECEERPWRFYGYNGFVLLAGNAGHLAYGDHNYNGHIIQLSGEFALRFWLQFVNVATNVSRIDLKVDSKLDVPNEDLALGYYEEAVQRDLHTQRKYSVVMSAKAGETLYVGARSSDQFGRVYDKTAQTKEYDSLGTVWRFEVEYKRSKAKAIAGELAARANVRPVEMFAQDIVATVFDWFDCRGVPPTFHRKGQGMIAQSAQIDANMGKMRWLRMQVSPSVKSLLSRGKGEEVICYYRSHA